MVCHHALLRYYILWKFLYKDQNEREQLATEPKACTLETAVKAFHSHTLDMLLQCEVNPFIIFTLSSTSCQRPLDMCSLGKDAKVFDVKLSLIDYLASEGAL